METSKELNSAVAFFTLNRYKILRDLNQLTKLKGDKEELNALMMNSLALDYCNRWRGTINETVWQRLHLEDDDTKAQITLKITVSSSDKMVKEWATASFTVTKPKSGLPVKVELIDYGEMEI